jgi:hypothetical protein
VSLGSLRSCPVGPIASVADLAEGRERPPEGEALLVRGAVGRTPPSDIRAGRCGTLRSAAPVLEASLGGTCHQTELGRAGVAGCTADDSMACCGDLRVGEEGEESVVLGLCHAHAPRDPSVFEVTLEETTPCIPRPEQR